MGDTPAPGTEPELHPVDDGRGPDPSAILAHAAYLAVPMVGMLGLVIAGASTELVLTWLMATGLSTGSQAVFTNVRKLRSSIGETNGVDVTTMLKRITEFETYQHNRNHDIVNALTPLTGSTKMLLDGQEQILAELKKKRAS